MPNDDDDNGLHKIVRTLSDHSFIPVNHSSIGSEDHCLCGFRPRGWRAWSEHVAGVIRDRYAIVELPEPSPSGTWEIHNVALIERVHSYSRGVMAQISTPSKYGPGYDYSDRVDSEDALFFAAALLAATRAEDDQ